MLVVAIAIFCTIGVAAENTLWADHSESSGAHSVLTGSEVPIMQEHSTAAPAGNAPSAPAPSEPRFVGAAAGNQRVELNWTVPSAPGDSSISSYRILRSRTSGAEAFLASVNSSTFDFVDTTVTNGLIYYYTIQAVNDAGPGASSTEAFATPATTPYTPLSLSARGSDGLISLRWSAPAYDGGASIIHYQLFKSTTSGGEAFLTNVSGLFYPDGAVVNGNVYFYTVRAVNVMGDGVMSEEVRVTAGLPSTEPLSPAVETGNGFVNVSWLAPLDSGSSPITSYKVYRSNASGTETFLTSIPASQLYFVDAGLANGVRYYYYITAINDVGESAASTEVLGKAGTVPSAPQSPSARGADGLISLRWSAPVSDGGYTIVAYDVLKSTSSGTEVYLTTVSTLFFVDTDVLNGNIYFYKIRAVNSLGYGARSDEVRAMAGIPPSEPRSPTTSTGNGWVNLSWQTPLDNGSASVTGYRIYRGTAVGAEVFLTSVPDAPVYFVDAGLTNGVRYYYYVTAVTDVSESPASVEVSGRPATTPTAPLTPIARGSDGSISLRWSAPASDGGSSVSAYAILRSTTSGAETYLATVTVLFFVDTDVLNGNLYYYKIHAINGKGNGTLSDELRAMAGLPSTEPRSPLVDPGNGLINLTWLAPLDNGSAPVTGYKIYRGTASGGEVFLTSVPEGPLYFVDSGLTNGVKYYYYITAINDVSESPASVEASGKPGTVPAAPQGLTARGADGIVSLRWSAPISDGGYAISLYQVFRSTTSGEEVFLANVGVLTYVDESVTNGYAYYYKVRAVNGMGSGGLGDEVKVTAGLVSTEPRSLQLHPGNGMLNITWLPPLDSGGAPVTNYKIYRGTASGGETLLTSIPASPLYFVDSGLTNGVKYYYYITAINDVGESPFSREISDKPGTAPAAPQALAATGSGGQVYLLWTVPKSDGGSPVLHYNIYRGLASDSLVWIGDSIVLDYLDLSVTDGVKYFYRVTAENTFGESDFSVLVSVTPGNVPSAPRDLSIERGDASNTLTWNAPESDGSSAITNYVIYRGRTSMGETLLTIVDDIESFTDTSVTNGLEYFYRVAARNSIGEGPLSEEVSSIPGAVPTPPQGLTATGTADQIALTWKAPASSGGWPILGYIVYRALEDGPFHEIASVDAPLTVYVDTSILAGRIYHYEITAVNDIGEGPSCMFVDAMAGNLPSAPEDLQAVAGHGVVLLTWDPPEDDGSSEILSYVIFRSKTSNSPTYLTSVPGDTTEFGDTTVADGSTYYYYVAARNAVGIGPYSEEVAIMPVGPSTPPQGLTAVGDENEVALKWSAPAYDGGRPLLYYNIYRASSPFVLIATVPSTVLTYVDEGVVNGHLYEYKVSAVNEFGEGDACVSVFVFPGEVPSAPTELTAQVGQSQITLNWTAPSNDDGCPINAYVIYRNTKSNTPVFLTSVPGNSTSYIDMPLSNGVTYYYTVAAQNAVGIGPMSNEVAGTGCNVPTVPLNPIAVGDDNQVSLYWTAPASDGGRPLLYYDIYRSTTSALENYSRIATIGSTVLSYIDLSARNGNLYYYKISAENVIGEGGFSDFVFAVAGNVPSNPLNLTGSGGIGQVTLKWEIPLSNGGANITGYIIYSGLTTNPQIFLAAVPGNQTSYIDIPSEPGLNHFYTVRAQNAVGMGPVSNEVKQSANGYLTPPLNVIGSGGDNQAAIHWDPPAVSGAGRVLYYHIYRQFQTPGSVYMRIATIPYTDFTYVDYGVQNGQIVKYKVSGQTSNNEGALSGSATVMVGIVPTNPRSLTVLEGNTQMTLNWLAPSYDGGYPIDTYIIYRSTSSNNLVFINSVGPNQTSFVDIPVLNGVQYFYYVQAQSRVGVGPISNEATGIAGSTPTVPLRVSIASSIGLIALNWTTPEWNGGKPLLAFNIYRSAEDVLGSFHLIAIVSPNTISYVDVNVSNGHRYYYALSAVNQIGEGGWSVIVTMIAGDVPSVPLNFRVNFGDTIAILVWGHPDSDGGTTIVNYVISRGSESGCREFLVAVPGTIHLFIDSDVCPGDTYYYSVQATNIWGVGPNSTEEVLIIATLPYSPQVWDSDSTDLDDFAKGTMNQISLKWCAPEFNGGDVLLLYLIYRGNESSTEYYAAVQAPVSTFVDKQVVNGVRYFYQIAAVNKIGEGPKSPAISAIPGSLPSKPIGLVLTAGDSQVLVNWSAPLFLGGCPVLNYIVFRGDSPDSGSAITVVAGTTQSFIDAGVSNGRTYFYSVAAQNAVGNSERSAETYSIPGSFPGMPTRLVASRGSNQIALTWSAPDARASAPILTYQVFRGNSPNDLSILASIPFAPLSYVDTSVENGLSYFYAVRAVNEFGSGPLSLVRQAVSGTLPGSPQNLVAESAANNVRLRWSAPSSSGGNPMVSYSVYRGTELGYENHLLGITAGREYLDGNVSVGVSYFYRVSATTTIGEGPLSNVASGHTSSGQGVASLEFGTIALVLAAIGAIVVAVLLLRRRGKP